MPPRPPLANTVKLELNWTSDGIAVAHNIAYALFGTSVDTSDTTTLTDTANAVMSTYAASGIPAQLSEHWGLNSVTASDNSGTSDASNVSTHARVPGTDASSVLPPQCAVCISWAIAARYRGGKPRWYLPGIPVDALVATYGSALLASWASALKTGANSFESAFNASAPNGHECTLGTISYMSGKVPRVTPVFRVFDIANVHERLDSQRRRSGKESSFPVTP